jgi:Cys-rich protein (TIGR01571 family)
MHPVQHIQAQHAARHSSPLVTATIVQAQPVAAYSGSGEAPVLVQAYPTATAEAYPVAQQVYPNAQAQPVVAEGIFVGQQPMQGSYEMQGIPLRVPSSTFDTQLCEFVNPNDTCIMGFFCACFLLARIRLAENINSWPGGGYYTTVALFSVLFISYQILGGLQQIHFVAPDSFLVKVAEMPAMQLLQYIPLAIAAKMVADLRSQYRMKYGIQSQQQDLLLSCCCQPCVLIQMANDRDPLKAKGGCVCSQPRVVPVGGVV